MQGRSHLLIGVSTYTALSLRGFAGISMPDLGGLGSEWALPASMAVVALGSLIPDIDQRQALLSRQMAVRPVAEVVSRVTRHRGPTHSLLALALVGALGGGLGATWGLPGLGALLVWGCLFHLLADMLTKSGVPLFWPLPARFRLLPIGIVTDSLAERLIVSLVVLASAAHVLAPSVYGVMQRPGL